MMSIAVMCRRELRSLYDHSRWSQRNDEASFSWTNHIGGSDK